MKKPLLGLIGIAVLLASVILPQPTENPIIRANGIVFLLGYALIIGATLGLCWAIARSLDSTVHLSPPPLPKDADPYEIAYLRQGTNGVTHLALFHLIQSQYLSVNPNKQIAPLPEPPAIHSLSPLEQDVFYWFSSPRPAQDIFLPSLVHRLEQRCAEYRQNLRIKKLLFETPKDAVLAFWLGRAILVGVGGYKLIVCLLNGQFYLGVMLVSLIALALWVLQQLCRTPRLSDRGRRYLGTLQQTFEGLNISPGDVHSNNLVVAVWGLSVLEGTPYTVLEKSLNLSRDRRI